MKREFHLHTITDNKYRMKIPFMHSIVKKVVWLSLKKDLILKKNQISTLNVVLETEINSTW